MKKQNILIAVMLGCMTLGLVGCNKENGTNENNNPSHSQKHNVELVYGVNPNTQWQNISMDTLNKYNSDPTVDSIFMIPKQSNQYSTMSLNGCKTLATYLRQRHNINPHKIFGKGNLELKDESVQNNPELVRFFADTLKYNDIYHTFSK